MSNLNRVIKELKSRLVALLSIPIHGVVVVALLAFQQGGRSVLHHQTQRLLKLAVCLPFANEKDTLSKITLMTQMLTFQTLSIPTLKHKLVVSHSVMAFAVEWWKCWICEGARCLPLVLSSKWKLKGFFGGRGGGQGTIVTQLDSYY